MSQTHRRANVISFATSRTLGALACAVALCGTASIASAADAQGSNAPTNTTPYTAPNTATPAMHASGTHAQHKAARKARRAHKNAELKTLEKNGYNPAQNDQKYPANIQNAERKAQGQPTQPSGQ